jgi:uncharacterized protein
MNASTGTIVDDVENHRFLYTEGGVEAQLVYYVEPEGLILEHTEVPNELGGRGIGGRLVLAAVERAEASGETLLPWCTYARKWLTEHPELADRATIDWTEPPAEET